MIRNFNRLQFTLPRNTRQRHYDVVIAGGGVMGSSSAYFLKRKDPLLKIAVIEKDLTYSKASSSLSVSSVRQQFSNIENIKLSQWSHGFMSRVTDTLTIDELNPPDVNLVRSSYMFLATKNGINILQQNCATQQSCGADIKCMTLVELKERYPWLNVSDVELGSICDDGREGWFDGWSLLSAFQKKAMFLGVDYINGECIDIDATSKINGIGVQTAENKIHLKCSNLVNATGPWAGYFMQKIGVHLPVVPRKRYVYVFDCPKGPGRSMPMMVDPSGVYCRPEGLGTLYLCGASPSEDDEPDTSDLDVNYDWFEQFIWPTLAERIPSMEELKLKHSWAGYYDYNTFDQNGIIGAHNEIDNLYFANGFSGHGIQQSPAVGNAISELIIDGQFTAIDLTKLGYDRIIRDEPCIEVNVV